MIVGIDEVGRGPWAGPLVVGAVVLGDTNIDGLTDSKKLSAKRRTELAGLIHGQAAAVGLGWVHAEELDEIGMAAALTLACRRALERVSVPYHEIIIDGTVNFLKDTNKGRYVTVMKKADLLIASVSAASVVAKVARDQWMMSQEASYPEYGFAAHVGYGTAQHKTALELHGITALHRRSFAPIRALLNEQQPRIKTSEVSTPTTKQRGDAGEAIIAEHLAAEGYTVLERNWKTRVCEIDIIAEKNNTYYFVEVKHRKNDKAGGGIAAITPTKLHRMKFASEVYMSRMTKDVAAQLLVATTIGSPAMFESILVIE